MIFYLGFQWKKTILDALGMTALTLDKHATKVFKGKKKFRLKQSSSRTKIVKSVILLERKSNESCVESLSIWLL